MIRGIRAGIHEARSRPGNGRRSNAVMITVASTLLLVIGLAAPSVSTAAGESWLEAPFLDNVLTQGGDPFTVSGSAYIDGGQGLRINESGVNLVVNPSFEQGAGGWTPLNGATATIQPGESVAGGQSLEVTWDGQGATLDLASGSGGIRDGELGDKTRIYSFSVYMKAPAAPVDKVWLKVKTDNSGAAYAGPFTVTKEWRRYTVSKWVTTEDTSLNVSIYRLDYTSPTTVLIDAAQMEAKSRVTTYFDGDQTGSSWLGTPHASPSSREAGMAFIEGGKVGLDFSQPFWFATDVTLGFNSSDNLGVYPLGAKDFLNMGEPIGDGYGMVGNEGVIFDYYKVSNSLTFYKINGKGQVKYTMPEFQTGDTMRAVCSYDPGTGLEMWVKAGENDIYHAIDDSPEAREPSVPGADWMLTVSGGYAWSAYGGYQSNSLHRNLIVKQGGIGEPMAALYISDPDAFLAACGVRPSLVIGVTRAYWNSVPDFESRTLSVDYDVVNQGTETAVGVQVVGSSNTNGVILVEPLPHNVGEVAGDNGTSTITLRYHVPQGVQSFKATLFAEGADVCGNVYSFPDSFPRN